MSYENQLNEALIQLSNLKSNIKSKFNMKRIMLVKEEYTDVMIDLETLDTTPTSVVLSWAIVGFNITTGQISKTYSYGTLNYKTQIDQGRTISVDTLLWWGGQEKSIRDEAFKGRFELNAVLPDLIKFLRAVIGEKTQVWANSPGFDLAILKNLMGDIECPWKHWNERDVRTYCNATPEIAAVLKSLDLKPTHHPVDDCLQQIEKVCAVNWMIKDVVS